MSAPQESTVSTPSGDEKIALHDFNETKTPEDVLPSDKWWTDEQEKRARRKLDLRILPIIFVLYGMALLDRRSVFSHHTAERMSLTRLSPAATSAMRVPLACWSMIASTTSNTRHS